MLRRASMLFYTNNHRHNTTFSAFMQEVFDILFQNGMPFLCSFPSFSSVAPNAGTLDGTVFFRQNHKSVPLFSQDAVHSVLCLHDIQFRDRTLFQPAQRQSALGDALQIRHRHPARGHHPPHLMVFALLHMDEALSMALRLQPCREALCPVAERQPRLERGAVLGGGGSLMLGIIRLPDAAARTEDAVRKVAVVRQQQQALRLLVKPPHRCHAELPVSLRDQLHHRPVARIVRRGHVARRLVQHQQDLPVFFDCRAVHRNGTCRLVKFFASSRTTAPSTVTRPARMRLFSSLREATPASERILSSRCIAHSPFLLS